MELKETVEGMLSEDYKERFIAEYQQVIIRLRSLKNMIDAYREDRLDFTPETPIELLDDQYKYMTLYAGALVKRAKLYEGIDLEEVK